MYCIHERKTYGLVVRIRLGAEILDMSQNMPTSILSCEITEISPQTHIGSRRFLKPPLGDWDIPKQDKSLSINDIVSDNS